MGSGNCKADCFASKDRNKLQIISSLEHKDVSLLMPNAGEQDTDQGVRTIHATKRQPEDEDSNDDGVDVPQIQIVELHEHLVVPHSIIDRKINEKIMLLVRKELPQSPILDSTSVWYLLSSGSYYTGPFHFNKAEGIGTYILASGSIFHGNVTNNEPEGAGTLVSQSGIFKGTFIKGRAHGSGLFEAEGVLVDGQWEDGQIVSGTVKTKQYNYTGQFKGGVPDGQGKYSNFPNKITLSGHFKKGHLDGYHCAYACPDFTYIGSYKEGKRHGKGTMTFSSEGKFQGNWQRDKFMPEHN